MSNTKQRAIHHTASIASGKNQLAAVNQYHKDKWGMKSTLGWYVGYNYFIDVNGSITNTRKVGEETIANVGHNCDVEERCDTISICLAGDFNTQLPNDKQIKALRRLLGELDVLYPGSVDTFHRDIQANRTCPGKKFTRRYLESVILEKKVVGDEADTKKSEEIEKIKVTLMMTIITLLRQLRAKLKKQ